MKDWATELCAALTKLEQASTLQYAPLNDRGSVVFLAWGDYKWLPLASAGPMIQKNLIEQLDHFAALTRVLLRGRPDDVAGKYDELVGAVQPVLQQNERVYEGDLQSTAADRPPPPARRAWKSHRALLYHPALDEWRFPDCDRFTVVLLPTVLSELDQLKITGRDGLKEKAERLIRQIKEYRRRGPLNTGVALAKDISRIMTRAVEPKYELSLPWLDRDNADDRILASVVEVMREFASSAVVVVSRDVNLQNKAEYARLPFLEPPEREPTVP